MAISREQLEQSIAGLEAQRGLLGDAVVGPAIAALQTQLEGLNHEALLAAEPVQKATILWMRLLGGRVAAAKETTGKNRYELEDFWERLRAVIQAQGGDVVGEGQFEMTAVWGVGEALAEETERAIRAALALKALVADENEQAGGEDAVQLFIGIHTGIIERGDGQGEWVLGQSGEETLKVLAQAPVAWTAISLATYQQVRGVFDVHQMTDYEGEIYLVEQAKPRPFPMNTRVVEGIATRMVGRELELEQLQGAMQTTIQDSQGNLVTLLGEAGLGKSRLLYEFDAWVELQPELIFYYKGRAQPGMAYLPFSFWRDVIKFRFQIRDSDTTAMVWRKMEQGIKSLLGDTVESERQAHIIGQMLGFDFTLSPHVIPLFAVSAEIQTWGYKYLAHFFVMMSDVDPTLIVLEDIHWADDTSLDFMHYLAQHTARHSLLMVCVARPTLLDRLPHWFKVPEAHMRIDLRPLSLASSRELFNEILQKVTDVPTSLVEQLISRANGNPFYMEEMIKLLVRQGAIVKSLAVWRVDATQVGEDLPFSLTDLLERRLSHLAPAEYAVLQQASVMGRVFWDSLLAYIHRAQADGSERERVSLLKIVHALQAEEFIYIRDMPAFFDAHEYIFTHILLQETAYDSLRVQEQMRIHSHVADWLLMRTETRLDEWAGLIGYHLVQAGRKGEAAHYFYVASQHAQTMGCLGAAGNFLEDGLALVGEGSAVQRQLKMAWDDLPQNKMSAGES